MTSERPTAYPSARDDIGLPDVSRLPVLTLHSLLVANVAHARAAWLRASEAEHAAWDAYAESPTDDAQAAWSAAREAMALADLAWVAASTAVKAAQREAA